MDTNVAKFGDGLEFDRGFDELCEYKRRFRTIGRGLLLLKRLHYPAKLPRWTPCGSRHDQSTMRLELRRLAK
jgi:hypothetical protein